MAISIVRTSLIHFPAPRTLFGSFLFDSARTSET